VPDTASVSIDLRGAHVKPSLTVLVLAALVLAAAAPARGQSDRWSMIGVAELEVPFLGIAPGGQSGFVVWLADFPVDQYARDFQPSGGSAMAGAAISGGGVAAGPPPTLMRHLQNVRRLSLWIALSENDITDEFDCPGPQAFGVRREDGQSILRVECGAPLPPLKAYVSGDFAAPPVLVGFDAGGAVIPPEDEGDLEELAVALTNAPGAGVLVEGTAEPDEPDAAALALRRAATVRDYLVSRGVDRGRVHLASYGSERPRAVDAANEAWAVNRKAHTIVTAIPSSGNP
jgi:hypothetical protein